MKDLILSLFALVFIMLVFAAGWALFIALVVLILRALGIA